MAQQSHSPYVAQDNLRDVSSSSRHFERSVYTAPIAGKERWFKLGPELYAEPAMRNGISGCRLRCDPMLFGRRGLSPEEYLDPERSPDVHVASGG